LVRHRPCRGFREDLLTGHFGGHADGRPDIVPSRGCILCLRRMRPARVPSSLDFTCFFDSVSCRFGEAAFALPTRADGFPLRLAEWGHIRNGAAMARGGRPQGGWEGSSEFCLGPVGLTPWSTARSGRKPPSGGAGPTLGSAGGEGESPTAGRKTSEGEKVRRVSVAREE